jgi:hypothetical protein
MYEGHVTSSSYTASNDRRISEKWIGKDGKGSGRELIHDITPTFAWGD